MDSILKSEGTGCGNFGRGVAYGELHLLVEVLESSLPCLWAASCRQTDLTRRRLRASNPTLATRLSEQACFSLWCSTLISFNGVIRWLRRAKRACEKVGIVKLVSASLRALNTCLFATLVAPASYGVGTLNSALHGLVFAASRRQPRLLTNFFSSHHIVR